MTRSSKSAAIVAIAATAFGACNSPESVAPVDHSTMHVSAAASSRSENSIAKAGLAKAVKAQAARFNSMKQAEKAGYVQGSPCIAIPTGGMGYHYLNNPLIDGTFDPMQPEVLVYAPTANGKLKLVAVEYIVLDLGQDAPTFDGQAFDDGGTPTPGPHWSLHVWLFEENPDGLFAPFNPNVSCPPPV
jgi:hypothetical protein